MGYKRKIYKLRWPEGHELHGLEVSMRGMSMDDLGIVVNLQGAANGEQPGLEVVAPLVDVFARNVSTWNLEDEDDNPIPTTPEAIGQQDARMLLQVVTTWADKAIAVAAPLKQPSSGGDPSLEGSIPMAAL